MDLSPLAGERSISCSSRSQRARSECARAVPRPVRGASCAPAFLDVEHWNPVSMQLWRLASWDGTAYRLVHPQRSGVAVELEPGGQVGADEPIHSLHYVHPLEDLVGGLCDSGFAVVGSVSVEHGDPSATPGSDEHQRRLRAAVPAAARAPAA